MQCLSTVARKGRTRSAEFSGSFAASLACSLWRLARQGVRYCQGLAVAREDRPLGIGLMQDRGRQKQIPFENDNKGYGLKDGGSFDNNGG